jgi:hypothetical protein
VDQLVSYAYFEPTPFTEWRISVDPKAVVLSKVSSIVMELAGSLIQRKT